MPTFVSRWFYVAPQSPSLAGEVSQGWSSACVGASEDKKVGTQAPPVSDYQRLLCLSEQRRKLKPLMKRPSVFLQEKPQRAMGQWPSGLW